MQNTPLWSLIAMLACVHLVHSLNKFNQTAKRQHSLLASNRITKGYLYILQYMNKTDMGSSSLLVHFKTTKQELVHSLTGIPFKGLRHTQYSNWPSQCYQCKWCIAVPVRKDDLLHVVCHEEVIKPSTLIPLHEGFLCPRKNNTNHGAEQLKLLMEILKDQINTP